MKLSVAMCTYNGDLYIKEQLQSIINQTVPVNEIIICDDGSTDNTIPLILGIKDETTNIKIELHNNGKKLGVIKNFEKAISLCTGDIIFLSDQDDIWLPHKVKTILKHFNTNPLKELVFTDAKIINEYGNTINNATLFNEVGFNKSMQLIWEYGMSFEIINKGNKITGATMAFRKELIPDALPFSITSKVFHDEQLAIITINRGTISYITDQLIQYRIHKNNVTGLGKDWNVRKKNSTKSINKIKHPYPIKDLFFSTPSINIERYKFYEERGKYINSIKGKLILILSIYKYYKYYNKYFIHFYLHDIYIGIPTYLKKKAYSFKSIFKRFCL